MIHAKQTLQAMLKAPITKQDFDAAAKDAHGIVKIIVAATMKEKAYDFLHIMMQKKRQQYTLNLFEKIQKTPWYDFEQPDGKRFVLIWQLETVADQEELVEYFSECMQEFTQDYGDVIVHAVDRKNPQEILQIDTHDNTIRTFRIPNDPQA